MVADHQWLDNACLGNGLPEYAEQQMRLAGQTYSDDRIAEAHLYAAQAAAPDHIAVQIGFYRFYFYKGRLEEARSVAERCLNWAASKLNAGRHWRSITAQSAAFDSFDVVLPRFFLFALKGYAYLEMRLRRMEEGRCAAAQLITLDPHDRLGGKRMLLVLDRQGRDDED